MGYDINKFSPSSGKALDSESNPINYIDILKLLNLKDGFHNKYRIECTCRGKELCGYKSVWDSR